MGEAGKGEHASQRFQITGLGPKTRQEHTKREGGQERNTEVLADQGSRDGGPPPPPLQTTTCAARRRHRVAAGRWWKENSRPTRVPERGAGPSLRYRR